MFLPAAIFALQLRFEVGWHSYNAKCYMDNILQAVELNIITDYSEQSVDKYKIY